MESAPSGANIRSRLALLTRPMCTHFPRRFASRTRPKAASLSFQAVDPPMNKHSNLSQGTGRFSWPSCPTNATGNPKYRITGCHNAKRARVAAASATTSGEATHRTDRPRKEFSIRRNKRRFRALKHPLSTPTGSPVANTVSILFWAAGTIRCPKNGLFAYRATVFSAPLTSSCIVTETPIMISASRRLRCRVQPRPE